MKVVKLEAHYKKDTPAMILGRVNPCESEVSKLQTMPIGVVCYGIKSCADSGDQYRERIDRAMEQVRPYIRNLGTRTVVTSSRL